MPGRIIPLPSRIFCSIVPDDDGKIDPTGDTYHSAQRLSFMWISRINESSTRSADAENLVAPLLAAGAERIRTPDIHASSSSKCNGIRAVQQPAEASAIRARDNRALSPAILLAAGYLESLLASLGHRHPEPKRLHQHWCAEPDLAVFHRESSADPSITSAPSNSIGSV